MILNYKSNTYNIYSRLKYNLFQKILFLGNDDWELEYTKFTREQAFDYIKNHHQFSGEEGDLIIEN